jgi:hypothetical protein
MFIPDPGSEFFPSRIPSQKDFRIPIRIRIRFKELKYFNPKILFPDPDLDFLPITDPGVEQDIGSRIRISNNGFLLSLVLIMMF